MFPLSVEGLNGEVCREYRSARGEMRVGQNAYFEEVTSQGLSSLFIARNTLVAGIIRHVLRQRLYRPLIGWIIVGRNASLSPSSMPAHRSNLSPSSTPSETLRDADAKSNQRRGLPLLVVVRPDRPDPVRRQPADHRPHRAVRWTDALGGVPSPASRQTLLRGVIWSVPFYRR